MLRIITLALMVLMISKPGWAARDPTCPPNANALTLTAIFFASDQQTAIINGQSVREHDTIDGSEILKITPDTVLIDGANGLITLHLQQYTVKAHV